MDVRREGWVRVLDNDDDTIPHVGKASRQGAVVDVLGEVALGATVMRESASGSAETVRVEPPPVPAALRPHHRIRVGDAEPIDLDRPVHIGRRPRAPRMPYAATPRFVEVASPAGGISATHLEVREQGVAVVASDMRTLNGSEVHAPGAPVRALLRGESLVVTPGTRIDLGEGVVVEILPPARAARDERTP